MSLVNIQELATTFDVSRPTIVAWIDDGLPFTVAGSKSKPWQFEVRPCIEWWAENKFRRRSPPGSLPDGAETYEEAERRKMVANADKAELELAKSAGLVVPIDEVAGVVTQMHVGVRSRLLGIGNQVRMQARSFFGGDRAAEEQIVRTVEEAVLGAMAEICDDPIGSDAAGTGLGDRAPE